MAGGDEWDMLIIEHESLKTTHTLYLLLGAFICAYGLVSLAIKERLYMSEAMVAVIVGILIGPLVGKLLIAHDVFGESYDTVTMEFTRLVVVLQCMACGIDLPGNYLWREKTSVLVLIGPVMIVMWLVAAVGIYVITGIPFLEALMISACLTPTDPVLANSIVKGRYAEAHIPLNVRLLLAAESGANDGLGTPILLFAIYLLRKANTGMAIGQWFYRIVLYQVGVAAAVGVVTAYVARKLLKLAERNGLIDKESLLSFSISLALLIMGICAFLGVDDVLAVFIAGNVLTWDSWFNEKIKESHFQAVLDALLNLAFFIYVGATIPWSSFGSTPELQVWKLVLLAIWILVLRRVPIVLLLQRWIPALKSPMEALFAGWFGPIGADAIFYSQIAIVFFGADRNPMVPICCFIILSSVAIHGGTVAFFNMSLARTQTYQNWAQAPLARTASGDGLSFMRFPSNGSSSLRRGGTEGQLPTGAPALERAPGFFSGWLTSSATAGEGRPAFGWGPRGELQRPEIRVMLPHLMGSSNELPRPTDEESGPLEIAAQEMTSIAPARMDFLAAGVGSSGTVDTLEIATESSNGHVNDKVVDLIEEGSIGVIPSEEDAAAEVRTVTEDAGVHWPDSAASTSSTDVLPPEASETRTGDDSDDRPGRQRVNLPASGTPPLISSLRLEQRERSSSRGSVRFA
ncbi:Sodium/hydrogen exchanger family-domain-containing protein [Zopfochytrium polystomum]|nr:Sodium/hydrogen exchanger family-domain-containing protein [Zopfochytrium polystomum]